MLYQFLDGHMTSHVRRISPVAACEQTGHWVSRVKVLLIHGVNVAGDYKYMYIYTDMYIPL
jgi:hypothetical protein